MEITNNKFYESLKYLDNIGILSHEQQKEYIKFLKDEITSLKLKLLDVDTKHIEFISKKKLIDDMEKYGLITNGKKKGYIHLNDTQVKTIKKINNLI